MSHFSRIAFSNSNFEQPSVAASGPHQASANAVHPDNGTAPPQTSNAANADPTRLALLQFGTQARARADALRGQLIGHNAIAHETYNAYVESAISAALNAGMSSTPIDEHVEMRNTCKAKAEEIYRFATENNGELFRHLFSLPEIPLHDRMPTVELADHKSAAILKSDIDFLIKNRGLWMNDPEVNEQVREYFSARLFVESALW